MYEILLTPAVVVLIFFLPGLSFVRIFHLPTASPIETTFYSISLSFAMIVAIGFLLGNTVGITVTTVLVSFLLASLPGIVAMGRKLRAVLGGKEDLWKRAVEYSKGGGWKLAIVAIVAVAVTAFNWSYAIGTHAVDMGEHVYWAKVIMTTSRMPNYYSVEPLDQAVKFTYGAHLMLAQFFLLAGIPIEDYSWIPTLVGSIAIWIGVAQLASKVTGSSWAGAVAAVLYGSAYQPFGYIERGNLPDIAGYLLLVSTLYSILRVRMKPSFSFALGLTAVSVIPYHQLATVILPIVILFTTLFSFARARSELFATLQSIFAGQTFRTFWITMFLLALAYAGTVAYVSSSAASQLITGNWRPYVPVLYDDPFIPGVALGILGIAGLVFVMTRRTLGFMLLLAWTGSLIFLTNALLVGIPIPDPLRFLWRLTEPFSILGAALGWFVFNARTTQHDRPLPRRLVRIRHDWVRVAGAFTMVALIAIQITGLVTPALQGNQDVLSFPARYRPAEAFFQDDKQIGRWVATNAPSTAVIANDADVDPTATWVQVYSMKVHFIYRADFAAIVAPANYIQIYQSTKILYESPNDARVPLIIQQYNLTYVVAHSDEIPLFASSPWFCHTPVFQSGGSALFATQAC